MSENKINILHLQNHLNISCGVSKTIYLIVKNTLPHFNHSIICFGGDGFSRFESKNIEPLILKEKNNSIFGFIIHLFQLHSFCKKNKINIIHSHHRYFDLLAFLISKKLNIKTVTSVHSKVYNRKFISYKSDKLIACSNSIKEHLINNYKINERRIKVIPNTVDPKDLILTKTKTELINKLNIPNGKFIIGYFGRLDFKEKGIDILLEAFLNLSKVNIDLFLLLVGSGEDENKIIEFITQNGVRAKVMSSQKDIFNYYQLLDVLILPSRIETFGIVIIEAGMMTKTVIASNVDGIPELLTHKENGLLFESCNVEELKEQIIKIYNDRKFGERLAKNLNKKVLASYTVDKIIPQYEKLYTELLLE